LSRGGQSCPPRMALSDRRGGQDCPPHHPPGLAIVSLSISPASGPVKRAATCGGDYPCTAPSAAASLEEAGRAAAHLALSGTQRGGPSAASRLAAPIPMARGTSRCAAGGARAALESAVKTDKEDEP